MPKLTKEEIESRNRLILIKELESIIDDLPQQKEPGPDGFTDEVYKTLGENETNSLQCLLEQRSTGILLNSSPETTITLNPNQAQHYGKGKL